MTAITRPYLTRVFKFRYYGHRHSNAMTHKQQSFTITPHRTLVLYLIVYTHLMFMSGVTYMRCLYQAIIPLVVCTSALSAETTWVVPKESQELYSVIESTPSDTYARALAQLDVDSKSCEADIALAYENYFDVIEVIRVNGTLVNVSFSGKNRMGETFFRPKTSNGLKYLITEFKHKKTVDVEFTHDKQWTFSASNFTRTLNSMISTCKSRKKLREQAL